MLGYDLSIPAVVLRRRAIASAAPVGGGSVLTGGDFQWRIAIFESVAEGLIEASDGDIFFVPLTEGLSVWTKFAGTAEPVGMVDRLEFDSVEGLAAYDGPALPAGVFIRTRREGYDYEVLAADASGADLIAPNGIRYRVMPDGDGVWDRQFFTFEDDADRVNAAIRWTIDRQQAESTVYKVKVRGHYTMNKPISAFRLNGAGTDFLFRSVHIEAPAQGYVNALRTRFVFTDGQNPGIVTQSIRQLTIRNVAIIGAANNLSMPNYDRLLDRDGWWNVNGAAESGFRTHAGILVDPFRSTQAAAQRWPHFDGSTEGVPNHYVANSMVGSTQILIDQCDIQGWVIAVNTSGSQVQVGDSITIEKCNLSYNRNCVVIGESQNRGIAVNDCHAKGFDIMFAGGSGFMAGTGAGNYVNGGVYVFGYSMVHMDTARGPGAFTNVYCESIWAIGHITGNKPFQFANCKIKFIRDHNGRGVSTVMTGGADVVFDGGYVGAYEGSVNQIAMQNSFVVQGGCAFDGPPVPCNYPNGGYFHWISGSLRYGAFNGLIAPRMTGSFGAVLNGAIHALPGMPIMDGGGGGGYWENQSGLQELLINASGVTATRSNGVVTLHNIDTSNIFVGDTLFSGTQRAVSDHRRNPNSTTNALTWVMGRVEIIDTAAGTCTLSGGSVDIQEGVGHRVVVMRWASIRRPRRATITSGSNVLTGSFNNNEWAVGQRLAGPGIPSGARILSRNTSQITLTRNATESGETDIYDGLFLPVTVRRNSAPSSGDFHQGSVIHASRPVKDENDMIVTGWICTEGGSPGTWEPMRVSAG